MTIFNDLFEKISISNLKHTDKQTYDNIIQLTPFLDGVSKVTHRQRLWHIVNDTWEIPTCSCCDNLVRWQTKIRNYSSFCSSKCAGSSSVVQIKRKDTCTEKYGVTSYSKTSEFRNRTTSYDKTLAHEKRKQTCLDKYGNECYLQSEQGSAKSLDTIKNKFGVDNVRKSPAIVNKIKSTIQDRYGMSHFNNTQKYKQHMAQLYADPTFRQECIDARQKTMMAKYGHLSIHRLPLTESQISKLDSTEWLINEHHVNKRTISDISLELSVDKQTILRKFHTNNIAIYRYQSSMMEREIADFVSQYVDIITNDRTILHPLELDIVIPSKNIAIEFNGIYWHSECAGKDKWYHFNKSEQCSKQGIQLLHIYEDDWVRNKLLVKKLLLHKLGVSTDKRIYARNCTISIPSKRSKRQFLDQHHIQGNGPSSVQLGLEHEGVMVGVMCFSKTANKSYYLTRYATTGIIVGGFSKLLQHFIRTYDVNQIISFANKEISDGSVYDLAGFELDCVIPPDYKYVIGGIRMHKFNFRKSRLKKLFVDYDDSMSETELMRMHNIPRIWGVGLMRFVYNVPKAQSD